MSFSYLEAPQHQTANLALVDGWVEDYLDRNPAALWIKEEIEGGNRLWCLESDGTDTYSISIYRNGYWQRHTSSVVIKRDADYVFGGDQPAEDWYAIWQYVVAPHRELEIEIVEDFDVQNPGKLGSPSLLEAGEITLWRELQFYTHAKSNGNGNFSGGQYCPLDKVQDEFVEGELETELQAVPLRAIRINGESFYVFGVDARPEMGYGSLYAISADSSHLIYSIQHSGIRYPAVRRLPSNLPFPRHTGRLGIAPVRWSGQGTGHQGKCGIRLHRRRRTSGATER